MRFEGISRVVTRTAGFIVTLDEDLREEDTAEVLTALRMVRHVVSVVPAEGDHVIRMARERVRWEYWDRTYSALSAIFHGKKVPNESE